MPECVPPIKSVRLDLVSMSPAFLRAALEGRADTAAALLGAEIPSDWLVARQRLMRIRLADLEADPPARPWLLRGMVLRAPVPRMIGHIGFHSPPDAERKVEVGYSVEPACRRQGYATEAVTALFDWATREHGIRRFVASVSPTNVPSLGLVRELGFVQTGVQWDDIDGEELVFQLRLDDAAGPD